jgi:RHS repeat-associated protein
VIAQHQTRFNEDTGTPMSTASGLYILIYDTGPTNGSVRVARPASSSLSSPRWYDAYGNQPNGDPITPDTENDSQSEPTDLSYRGESYNGFTGIQYLRARHYETSTGRFGSVDPYAGEATNPLTLHKYGYVHGNPISGADPSGMMTAVIQLNGGMAIAGVIQSLNVSVVAAAVGTTGAALLVAAAHELYQSVIELQLANVTTSMITLAPVVSDISAFVGAIRSAAVAAAAATGINWRTLLRTPIFPAIRSFYPTIYTHNVTALAATPHWFVLNYAGVGAGRAQRRANLRGLAAAGTFLSWDEYPYASTMQGSGFPVPVSLAKVPIWENRVQGGFLSAFYRLRLKGATGKAFMVVPINI